MHSFDTFNLHFTHCLSYSNHSLLNWVTPNRVLTAIKDDTWKIWLNHLLNHILSFLWRLPQDSVFFWGQNCPSFLLRCVFPCSLLWAAKYRWFQLLPCTNCRREHRPSWSSACYRSRDHSSQASRRWSTRDEQLSLILLFCCWFCSCTVVPEFRAWFGGPELHWFSLLALA